MSLWDEWREHPCTKAYLQHLAEGAELISDRLSDLQVDENLQGKYAQLSGWRAGLREAINHAGNCDED